MKHVRLYLFCIGFEVDIINPGLSEADEVLLALGTQQDDRVQVHLQAVKLLRHVLGVLQKENTAVFRVFEIRGLRGLRDRKQMLVLLEHCCFVVSGLLCEQLNTLLCFPDSISQDLTHRLISDLVLMNGAY